jgi:hypothetical protein
MSRFIRQQSLLRNAMCIVFGRQGIESYFPGDSMEPLALAPLAAIGYSILYMLLGGGLGGAIVIFFIAKMFGK